MQMVGFIILYPRLLPSPIQSNKYRNETHNCRLTSHDILILSVKPLFVLSKPAIFDLGEIKTISFLPVKSPFFE